MTLGQYLSFLFGRPRISFSLERMAITSDDSLKHPAVLSIEFSDKQSAV